MADLPKIKVQKKSYSFDIKKKYVYEKHYKVVKKSPLDVVKESIQSFLKPKPAVQKKATGLKTAGAQQRFNPIVIGGAVLVAILLIIFVWVWLSLQSVSEVQLSATPILEQPSLRNVVFDSIFVTAGDRLAPRSAAFIGINYNASNVDNYTARVLTYKKNVYSEVFLLRSDVEDAEIYPFFVSALRAELKKSGISLSDISIRELETIPGGSVVVVPSGYLPIEMIGGGGSGITPDKLASRGVVVIYVGKPFSRVYNNGLPMNVPDELKKNIPFTFNEAPLKSEGIRLIQPLYYVSGSNWQSSLAYGSVSVLTKDDGAFVFFPQSLSSGWEVDPQQPSIPAYQYAAEDIAKVIVDMPWASPDDPEGKSYVLEEKNGSSYLLTDEFDGNQRSAVIWFQGEKNVGGKKMIAIDRKVVSFSQSFNGKIFFPNGNHIVPSSISGRNVRAYLMLSEPGSAQQVDIKLIMLNSSGGLFTEVPVGRMSTQSDTEVDMNLDPPRGEYLLFAVDDSGKKYAASYLSVSSIKINYNGKGKKQSSYLFSITMDGKPTQLNQVVVTVDGGKYGNKIVYPSVYSNLEIDLENYTGGDSLPPGNHTFEFAIGNLVERYYLDIPTPQIPFFQNPMFVGAIFLSILIVAVGFVFARKEEAMFSIDIPDFPPLAKEKITLSSDVILSLFEKVNANYQWKFTPLLLSEVKSGFQDIYYKGEPIYVTDYNVEFILDKMIKQGKIVKRLDYYAPKMWEEKSNKPISYLVLLRALRDICITNAVPFTGLGESKVADSEIDVMGQKMFIHFYYEKVDVPSLMKKIFNNITEGINIILFENEIEKIRFKKLLKSPTTPQLVLKLEVESNNVQLLTIQELEKMIKDVRNI